MYIPPMKLACDWLKLKSCIHPPYGPPYGPSYGPSTGEMGKLQGNHAVSTSDRFTVWGTVS